MLLADEFDLELNFSLEGEFDCVGEEVDEDLVDAYFIGEHFEVEEGLRFTDDFKLEIFEFDLLFEDGFDLVDDFAEGEFLRFYSDSSVAVEIGEIHDVFDLVIEHIYGLESRSEIVFDGVEITHAESVLDLGGDGDDRGFKVMGDGGEDEIFEFAEFIEVLDFLLLEFHELFFLGFLR